MDVACSRYYWFLCCPHFLRRGDLQENSARSG